MKMGVMNMMHTANDGAMTARHAAPTPATAPDERRERIASHVAAGKDGVSTVPAYLSSMMLLAHGLFNEPASAVHS